MNERDPDLEREEIRLPDGRRLVYYRFPDEEDPVAPGPGGGQAGDAPLTPTLSPAPRGPGRRRKGG